MAGFVKLNNLDRKVLIQTAKVNSFKNYGEFAKTLGVSRDMVFKYSRGDYLLPEELFLKLVTLSNFHPKSYKLLKREKYNRKTFEVPELSEDLAEILGVLNGDGHLSKINHEISVIGNVQTDENYFRYLKKKFENILGIAFKSEKFEHYLKLRAYSIDLVCWLNKSYALPKGKKKGSLIIPEPLKGNAFFLSSYLKGLFDTDGTFYTRRANEPVIEISSADKNFLMQIQDSLCFLGFDPGLGKNRVFLYRKEEIAKFFKEIRPANPKHLKKYKIYSKISARVV